MIDPSTVVTCDAELEAAVGKVPGVALLKTIRYLDEHCTDVLAHSTFAVLGTAAGDGALQAIARGGAPGHLAPRTDTVLELGDLSGEDVADGAPAGLLALVPGYGESLRVNGRLRLGDDGAALEVEEAFLHCAKAIIRSELWGTPVAAEPDDAPAPTIESFLADAPFVMLASVDADGHADVSPKGDPAGLLRRIDDRTIAIADRPGNRRTDTLHNLMGDPRLALLALLPGSHHVAEIRGTARVSTDAALLESMRLRGKTPKAALVIDVDHEEVRREPAVAAAELWDPSRHVAKGTLPRGATIWADHVRRNTDAGTGAKVARRVVSEKALAAGVALDYKANL